MSGCARGNVFGEKLRNGERGRSSLVRPWNGRCGRVHGGGYLQGEKGIGELTLAENGGKIV